MAIVSEIRESRGIIIISADGCEILRVRKTHFAKNPIECGEEVDFEAYENAIAGIQFNDAYEAALTSLDFCARTAREVKRSLSAKGYVPCVAEAIVQRLCENHLIDDKRLADRIAEANAKKPVGVYAMQRKLRAKGISDEDAAEALETFDDEQQADAAKKAAEKLFRRYSALPRREARAKLSQALARRGFSWDAIQPAVNALLDEDYE